jgi:REP element-mobilizing transposase RayT
MLPEESYHIYNHANGRENLFVEERNYDFFLEKLFLHILPVARIYSYCLLPNHFHLLVSIRTEQELLDYFKISKDELISQNIVPKLENQISKSFSNLFSSYTQAFNKVYSRMGSLFIPSFRRRLIINEPSFCKVIHYIHANPIHHGFVMKMEEWQHSSYNSLLNDSDKRIERQYVLKVFGGLDQFISYHKQPIDIRIKTLD